LAITIEKKSYEIPDPGTYSAQITSVTLEDGEYGEQIRFSWDAVDGAFEDLWYFCSKTLSQQSKLGKLCVTLRNCDFSDLPSQVEIEDLIGKEGQVVIEHSTSKSSGNVYAKITTVLPAIDQSEDALPAKWQERIQNLMNEKNVGSGILQSLFSVNAVSKLNKEQAKQLVSQIKEGSVDFSEPESDDEDIPF